MLDTHRWRAFNYLTSFAALSGCGKHAGVFSSITTGFHVQLFSTTEQAHTVWFGLGTTSPIRI